MLPLPSDFAFALAEFTVEELFRDASVRHAGDMACPSQLGLAHDNEGASEVSLLLNLTVCQLLLCSG